MHICKILNLPEQIIELKNCYSKIFFVYLWCSIDTERERHAAHEAYSLQ